MSASLVGSEMCIRDRFSPRFAFLSTRASWRTSALMLTSGHHLNNSELFPVSYTHLTLPTICSV
eukprot:2075217-Alexandrium_andersonii.AAC.1